MEATHVLKKQTLKEVAGITKKIVNLGVYMSTIDDFGFNFSGVKPLVVEVAHGMCVLQNIHKGKFNEANIEYGFAEAGTLVHPHVHDSWENIIITCGEIHIYLIGRNYRAQLSSKNGANKAYYINPGVPHFSFFPKDTWFYSVTIPADPGFDR